MQMFYFRSASKRNSSALPLDHSWGPPKKSASILPDAASEVSTYFGLLDFQGRWACCQRDGGPG